jgi:serine phosphatase RsbU (regulator of sigma subunit)
MREAYIRQVPLFVNLPEDEIRFLASSLQEVTLPANEVLFHEGDDADRFFILMEGLIEIVKELGTPDERLLGVREPGSFIGEMSLFNPEHRRTASVRARTALKLLEMTRTDFDALLTRQPTLAHEMVRVLTSRLAATENATIRDLRAKNLQLTRAYDDLQTAHIQIVEKEKLDHELQVAREIQASILPRRLPRLQGFDVGARMEPATAVGGDFFDFVPLGSGRLGVAVGDVSDKGMPSAIFMALTRSLIRAEAVRDVTPLETLRSVNRLLLDMNDAGMFVTVLYGVLDAPSSMFTFARAGHESPLVADVRGELLSPVRQAGQPLGLFPSPTLSEQSVRLDPGALLLIFTDGVTDAVDTKGEDFGIARLRAALANSARGSAQAVCDSLFASITSHRGSAPQHDDVTLVAVKARP